KQAEVADLILEESTVQVAADTFVYPAERSSADQSSVASRQSPASSYVNQSEERSDEGRAVANDQGLTTNDCERKRAIGIRLRDGRTVRAQAVIITTGTFLNGLIHCGEQQ